MAISGIALVEAGGPLPGQYSRTVNLRLLCTEPRLGYLLISELSFPVWENSTYFFKLEWGWGVTNDNVLLVQTGHFLTLLLFGPNSFLFPSKSQFTLDLAHDQGETQRCQA